MDAGSRRRCAKTKDQSLDSDLFRNNQPPMPRIQSARAVKPRLRKLRIRKDTQNLWFQCGFGSNFSGRTRRPGEENFGATTLAGAMESRLAKSALRFAQTCLRTGLTGRIFPPRIPQPFAFSSAFAIKYIMTDEDERELETELARLQQEHRDLDAAIDALHQSPAPDLLRLQRLKKRKLQLRDRIAFIEDQITPDIIA
jgi:hypothetical protein